MGTQNFWSEGGLSKSSLAPRNIYIYLYNLGKCFKNKLSIHNLNPVMLVPFCFKWQGRKDIFFTKKFDETYIGSILSMLGA